MAVRALRRVGFGLFLVLVLLLAGRSLVGDVYRVTSRSMNPTLWGDPEDGDFVLVTFGGTDDVERFDLVVLRRDGEPEPYVKRVVGLPGESVQIRDGDLYVDGELLPPDTPRPAPIAIFDLARHPLDERFGCPDEDAWVVDGGVLELRERPEPDELSAALVTTLPILDDCLDPTGARVRGAEAVNDLVVELAFRLSPEADACGALRVELTEQGDRFRLDLAWAETRGEVVLSRGLGVGEPEELARAPIELAPGAVPVRFANVDNALAVDVGGARVLTSAYEANRPVADRPGPKPVHWKPRVTLSGRGKPGLELTELRLLRDLVYTRQGDFGTREPVALGPDEVFLLGDSSPTSNDGRIWGAVLRDQLLGRPRAVVWPPARARVLRGS